MSNQNPENRRRYEEEQQRYAERRDYQGGNPQDGYPRDQARYAQGGYSSDEYDTGWNQRNYGRAEGGDFARGSGGYGRQESSSRYSRGDYGRSTDHHQSTSGRSDTTSQQEEWRTGNPRHHEDYGRGGYAPQSESGRWGGYGQSDYNRSGSYAQGQSGRGTPQGYGQSTGMGGTYEGEFGPEPGSRTYGNASPEWSYTDVWMMPGPMTGRGPEGYQRSDERIKEDVCERLTQHGQLDASNIKINVTACEVTLEGTVDSRGAKRMAEDTVESVSGVRDVHNQLRVQQNDWQPGTPHPESLPKGKDSMKTAENQSSGSGTGSTATDGSRN
jgi:osmotically-inducible protein OsmY